MKTGILQNVPTRPQPIVITLLFPALFVLRSSRPGFSSLLSVSTMNASIFVLIPYGGGVFFLNQFLWCGKHVFIEKRIVGVGKMNVEIAVHSIVA